MYRPHWSSAVFSRCLSGAVFAAFIVSSSHGFAYFPSITASTPAQLLRSCALLEAGTAFLGAGGPGHRAGVYQASPVPRPLKNQMYRS